MSPIFSAIFILALTGANAQDPPLVTSSYTSMIKEKVNERPSATMEQQLNPSIPSMKCVRTLDQPRYVGVELGLKINAPLKQVQNVLNDIEHYIDLSPGFDEIRVLNRQKDRVLTYWEKHVPLFFIPNLKYYLVYFLISQPKDSSWAAYRYQLSESPHLSGADGLVVIEARGPSTTELFRTDFIYPSKGMFGSAPVNKIWDDSLSDMFLANVAIKIKAEHSEWPYSRVTKEAKELLEKFPPHCSTN